MRGNNPFQFGLFQRMRRFFEGDGNILDCLHLAGSSMLEGVESAMHSCDHPQILGDADDRQDFEFSVDGRRWSIRKPDIGAGTPAHEFLRRAAGHMEDRAKTYDAAGGERSIGRTVAIFNQLYGKDLTEEQGWMFMAILKMVRSTQGPVKEDSYEDLAAYAGLAGESATRERRKAQ